MSDSVVKPPKPPWSPSEELIVTPKPLPPQRPAGPDLVFEVEQFLFREVRLFEEERYEEWLSTLTEDVQYGMPGIQARYRKDKSGRVWRERMAHFDEDLLSLRRRVTRALHPTAWAEDPPTRTVYQVSNVEVELTDRPDEFVVYSTVLNCRGRGETDEDWLLCRRTDVMRRGDDGVLRLARREIRTTQTVLLAKNLNILL